MLASQSGPLFLCFFVSVGELDHVRVETLDLLEIKSEYSLTIGMIYDYELSYNSLLELGNVYKNIFYGEYNNKTTIVSACLDNNIRIWDYYDEGLLYKITIYGTKLNTIFHCKNNIFVAGNCLIILENTNVIQIITEIQNKNVIQILNENKTYYLDFTVDHLIKLDNKYLDAEVTFINSNGTEYVLNKTKTNLMQP